jgi:ribosomal protein L11 methyltransferase
LFSLLLHPSPEREEYLIGELWECGTAGIVEEEDGIRAFFDRTADAGGLLCRFTHFEPDLRQEEPIDWAQVSRDSWPPIEVGERFFLAPPWCTEATPASRLRLPIYPGMACGTGRHPATQLALEAIEQHVQPGDCVVDVGTGSGILAAAAALVGAGSVAGCDLDADAVGIARQRLSTPLFIGSAAAIRSAWADVVIANIDSATIEALAGELARIRKPDSTLILTGFPEWDVPGGFPVREILRREEWQCLIC